MSSKFGQVEPAVFQAYAFWAGVLGLKMLLMSVLTGLQRGSKKVFSNPEDVKPGGKVAYDDPDVERVRRAHRNDMENILPFFIIGFLYMFTNPSVTVAVNLFRLVAVVRISHTVFHVLVPVHKFRGMSWVIGFFTTAFMELSLGLRNVRVTVPTAVRRGDPAHLYCEYELEDNERLYSIKWYKGKREFYRYTPQVHPSVQVFSTVSGIDVERSLSNESHVVMKAVEINYSGKYSCEVSADAPSFHTIINSGDMEVVEPPIEQPSVTGVQARYRPGDILRANCTSHNSKPAANLTWTINDVPLPLQYVKLYRPIKDTFTGLETSIAGVNFMVAHDHFVKGKLKLKCSASIHQLYHETVEHLVPEDRPRILATGVSASGHSISLYQGTVHETEQTDQNDAYLTVNGYKADKSAPLSSSTGSLQIDSYVKVCWVTFYICIICTVMVYSIRYLMVT